MRGTLALGLTLGSALSIHTAQAADAPKAGLESWWQRINDVLDEVAESKKIVPPTPRKVRWQPRKIWDGSLAGSLVDLVAGDLDGDGDDELFALTSAELVMLSQLRGLYDIRARVPTPDAPAALASRDPIGSATVVKTSTGAEIRARSSEQSEGGIYALDESGSLVQRGPFKGYPICEESAIDAAPGRNYLLGKSVTWKGERSSELSDALYSVRCMRAVDPEGHPLLYLSEVSAAGALRLQCEGEAAHCDAVARDYQGVGYAHLVADVDNDGYPEVLTSGSGLPGSRDSVVVYTQRDHKQRLLYDKVFAGSLVAIAAGDFDGDGGLEIVAAVREQGKVSLWLLN